MTLTVGTKFDTAHEIGCIVTTEPDNLGNFLALDSDGIECSYSLQMVTRTYLSPDDTIDTLEWGE